MSGYTTAKRKDDEFDKEHDGLWKGRIHTVYRTFSVDVRSVNTSNCDLSVRMPRSMSAMEEKVREFVSGRISRRKVDV